MTTENATVMGWAGTGWTPTPEYAKDTDNLIADFYLPAMTGAVRYDRITGYFASTVFVLYWEALRTFLGRSGRIRILCSPALSEPDANGLALGYQARNDAALATRLEREFTGLLRNPELRMPAQALACLIASGTLEVRIARVKQTSPVVERRMFHDKVGVFVDQTGQTIGFRGSANETFLGLSELGNVESIDTWASWLGHNDEIRATNSKARFDRLWDGKSPGVQITALPEGLRTLIHREAEQVDLTELMDRLAPAEGVPDSEGRDEPSSARRQLRPNQVEGLRAWREAGKRGILAHATGSGKTVTGIEAIREHTGPTLVVAPTELVTKQWVTQLREALVGTGRKVHQAGAGETGWRGRLSDWVDDDSARVIVAVAPTAADADFVNSMRRAKNLLLVGDEVHRLGAPSYRKILNCEADFRLGLSATPQRAGDPEGTTLLWEHFGGVVHSYQIQDAIADGTLSPYRYHPAVIRLTTDELAEWEEVTRQLGRAIARTGGTSHDQALASRPVKALIMKRARIARKASRKVPVTIQTVVRAYQPGQRWLIYCDDKDQMGQIETALRGHGLPALSYYSDMDGDKHTTLAHLDANAGVIVSIKCLDEGVDIPAADHAVIVASSKNPREFIQRRGRVLRKSPGKTHAEIYDLIVVPAGKLDESTQALVWGELARAAEFAQHAINTDARYPLEQACLELEIALEDLYALLGGGTEEDEDDA